LAERTWIVSVTLGSSRQSIVMLEGWPGYGRTRSSVVGNLVVLVIVRAFDKINLSGLRIVP